MELSKEHFDEQVAKLATKEDVENLARMVQHGFADVTERLDIREQVEAHERDIEEIKRALRLA
jgi:predicted nucleotidyltransferase